MDKETMLEYYKKEVATLIDRCLDAEADRDRNDRLYKYMSKENGKNIGLRQELEEQVAFLTQWKDDLLTQIDLLKEWVEDHGGNPEAIIKVEPDEEEEEEADGEV